MSPSILRDRGELLHLGYQDVEGDLRRLGRRETWLWTFSLVAMLVSSVAFVLLSIPALFPRERTLLQIDPESARQGLMGLILLFSASAVYHQWFYREHRRQLLQQMTGSELPGPADEADAQGRLDPVTDLCGRRGADRWLGKQIAWAKREGKPLTLLLLDLDDFRHVNECYGKTFGDLALREFAKRLKRASRGSDLVARLGADEFLMALPDCHVGTAKKVLDRIGSLDIKSAGKRFSVTSSAAWVDYQPGETPTELLKRADQMLQLYKKVSSDNPSPSVVAN